MRPGQSCPGVGRKQSDVAWMEVQASMRPGQSCPGVGGRASAALAARVLASMRPGQSCPGVVPARLPVGALP